MSYDVPWTVVPIQTWPGTLTRNRKRSTFRAPWSQARRRTTLSTLDLLERELRMLGAKNVILQAAVTDVDIRLDGKLRANARPEHPGVILTFDSRHGPLSYPCDRFDHYQDNVRAIALALEALRKVDRYGVTKRGEQYTGWKAIPASTGGDPSRGRDLIEQHGSVRAALFATHPDHGGDSEDFQAVQAVRNGA